MGGENVPSQVEKMCMSPDGLMGLTSDTFCFRIINIIPPFDSFQEMHNSGFCSKRFKCWEVGGCRNGA